MRIVGSTSSDGQNLGDIQNRLVNVATVAMLVLGLPPLVSSYMRIREIGWVPTMAFHTVAVLSLVPILLLRARIDARVRGAFLIALLYLLGSASFPSMATAGSGVFFYIIAVVLATVIYGVPVGIAAWLVCTLSIGAAFVGQRLGWFQVDIDFNSYVLSTASWVAKLTTFAMFGALAMALVGLMRRWLSNPKFQS